MDRQHVLANGLNPSEPDLTTGLVLDVASAISHLFVPCTWWQFDDLSQTLTQAWRFPRKFDRHVEQAVTVGWAAKWPEIAVGNYDPTKVSKLLGKNVWRDRKGWHGPVVLKWAMFLQLAQAEGVASGRTLTLTRQAAAAQVEAAAVVGAALVNGRIPPSPPSQVDLRPGIDWLTRNWTSLERDGLAPDAAGSPWWWFLMWARGDPPTIEWAHHHPALIELAGAGSPQFRSWWPGAFARVQEQQRIEAERQLQILAERARKKERVDLPQHLPTGAGIRVGNYGRDATPFGGAVIQQSYPPGGKDYSGKQWWLP